MYNKIFLSAELSTLSHTANSFRTQLLEQTLKQKRIPHLKVFGSYKGVKEVSFMLNSSDYDIAVQFMKIFKQDSILVIGPQGLAKFVYSDKTSFTSLRMAETSNKNLEAYTQIGNKLYTLVA